jgi:hypothetical protein
LAVIDIYVSIAKKSAVAVAAGEAVPVEEAAAEDPYMTGVKPQPDKRKARKTSSTPIRYFGVTASADTEKRLQVISGFLLKNTVKYPVIISDSDLKITPARYCLTLSVIFTISIMKSNISLRF